MKKILLVLLAILMLITMGCSRDKEAKISPSSLRPQPSDSFSMDDVRTMLLKYNFYDRFRNKKGSFNNNFMDNNDGTVTDMATGLMRDKHATSGLVKWFEVDSYISELNEEGLAGYSDWRLPTIEELASLLDEEFRPLNISDIFTFDIGGNAYWSADTQGPENAFYIDLIAATVSLNFFGEKHPGINIKAVRSL